MKNLITYIIFALIVVSCGKNKSGDMTVNGAIDGLKKGTIYLQKIKDTILVSVDSVQLNGESMFTLTDEVESPEMYYVQLNDLDDKVISFFGEKGVITINSKLDKFATSAKITGSSRHDLLNSHLEMIKKFNGKQLDLIKEKFEAQRDKNDSVLLALELNEERLIRRKIYYSANFAITNKNSEVAPYVALTELNYANVKLLDTVNNSLTKKVKKSKYGEALSKFIEKIKISEK